MLKTAMIFNSNMVLQRQKDIKIWGTGDPGKTITGSLIGNETTTAKTWTSSDGIWMITFPPHQAERNMTLTITDGIDSITLHNVCIGEVWLAGGQSNMEYPLQFDEERDRVLENAINSDIRFFDYPEVSYEGQLQDYNYSKVGFWRNCSKEDLPYFSAVGYYFAKDLQEHFEIPIGIIGCNWGGTLASAWMDPDYLKENEGKDWLKDYENAIVNLDLAKYKAQFHANPMNDHSDPIKVQEGMFGKIMYPGLTPEEQKECMKLFSGDQENMPMPQIGPYYENRPGGLYETMLKKIAPYAIRGVIWYQGESDSQKAKLYGTVFSKMIECWRHLWQDSFPFLFVQLAPFGQWLGANGESFPELRNQQELVSKTVPDTWMISSSDAGMLWDIHPKNKKPIGNRLALLARGHVYNEALLCDPPELLEAVRVSEGIRIRFRNGDGLHIKGDKVNAMVITDRTGKEITSYHTVIIHDSLLLKGTFPDELTISFAKTAYYEVNLYNRVENPVKPFEVII